MAAAKISNCYLQLGDRLLIGAKWRIVISSARTTAVFPMRKLDCRHLIRGRLPSIDCSCVAADPRQMMAFVMMVVAGAATATLHSE